MLVSAQIKKHGDRGQPRVPLCTRQRGYTAAPSESTTCCRDVGAPAHTNVISKLHTPGRKPVCSFLIIIKFYSGKSSVGTQQQRSQR